MPSGELATMASSRELDSPHCAGPNSPQFIPKHLTRHDVQIPHSEDDNPTKWVSVNDFKLTDPNSDNGRSDVGGLRPEKRQGEL
jgi:hypothetical protein